jgi:hypothetical protein
MRTETKNATRMMTPDGFCPSEGTTLVIKYTKIRIHFSALDIPNPKFVSATFQA